MNALVKKKLRDWNSHQHRSATRAADPSRPEAMPPFWLRRLKSKQNSPDGTLDLHGMTRRQAVPALQDFLLTAVGRRARCLYVCTGRGQGILSSELPQVLVNTNMQRHILGMQPGRNSSGCVVGYYLILKRQDRLTGGNMINEQDAGKREL